MFRRQQIACGLTRQRLWAHGGHQRRRLGQRHSLRVPRSPGNGVPTAAELPEMVTKWKKAKEEEQKSKESAKAALPELTPSFEQQPPPAPSEQEVKEEEASGDEDMVVDSAMPALQVDNGKKLRVKGKRKAPEPPPLVGGASLSTWQSGAASSSVLAPLLATPPPEPCIAAADPDARSVLSLGGFSVATAATTTSKRSKPSPKEKCVQKAQEQLGKLKPELVLSGLMTLREIWQATSSLEALEKHDSGCAEAIFLKTRIAICKVCEDGSGFFHEPMIACDCSMGQICLPISESSLFLHARSRRPFGNVFLDSGARGRWGHCVIVSSDS